MGSPCEATLLPHRMKKARLSAMMHSSGVSQSVEVPALCRCLQLGRQVLCYCGHDGWDCDQVVSLSQLSASMGASSMLKVPQILRPV